MTSMHVEQFLCWVQDLMKRNGHQPVGILECKSEQKIIMYYIKYVSARYCMVFWLVVDVFGEQFLCQFAHLLIARPSLWQKQH